MMCPNCKTPCVGCAGAKITKASNGATVCTKCVGKYELGLKEIAKAQPASAPSNVSATPNPHR